MKNGCSWCGGGRLPWECYRVYRNRLGEEFCSPGHRSSSNRALLRLTGETMDELVDRTKKPG
jgi:hypothetical protein